MTQVDIERKKYQQAYYANEADANKRMSFANALGSIYMIVIWILYLTVFKIKYTIIKKINISFATLKYLL